MHIAMVEKASIGMSDRLVKLNKHKMDIVLWASSSRGDCCEKMLDPLSLAALVASDVVTCTLSIVTLGMFNMAHCDRIGWRTILYTRWCVS